MACLARATAAALLLGAVAFAPSAFSAPPRAAAAPVAAAPADPSAEVVLRALSLLGVNYRFGGNTPETGLDCSGLVRFVFHDTLGMPLPRRSEEMSRVGSAVSARELQPGDLVFFNTLRRAFSHVGIYIGNNQFVHAPATGKSIRVESLGTDYWVRRFNGARRLLDEDGTGMPDLAQPDALIAAGLVPAPPGTMRAGAVENGARVSAAASRGAPRVHLSRRSPAAIVPPFEFRRFGNDLTMN